MRRTPPLMKTTAMATRDSVAQTTAGGPPASIPPEPKEPIPATVAAEAPSRITSKEVKARELEHIHKNADDPLVGLALSGGGIRSATFALGLLQAFESFGFFKHIDYISSVSGGGYIGGWLQAATARGRRTGALALNGQEPRDVRFLRAYSNYLTPRLGLFSGDTWAAIGNSLRNLVLNLIVLSLSLLAPLYLPWILALAFWRLVPVQPSAYANLLVAGALLIVTVAISTLNMAQPLADGTWSKAGSFQASTWQVQLFVVMPALLAAALLSTAAWAWARHFQLEAGHGLWPTVLKGGLAYGAVWLTGATVGFAIGARRRRRQKARGDLLRATDALVVLVITAIVAGSVGTFVLGVSSQAVVNATHATHTWLTGLLLFPIAVVSLLLSVTIHIGLAGPRLSDETREWWGRVGGTQLLLTSLMTVLTVLALAGPHLFPWIARRAEQIHLDPTLVTSILGGLWAAITGAGVFAGKSSRTADGGGSGWLEKVGHIAPIVFVLGYLLILATLLERSIPIVALTRGDRGWTANVYPIDQAERSVANMASAAATSPWEHTGPATVTPEARPTPFYEGWLLGMGVLTALLAYGVSRRVDLNQFSLHALYRNRLVRCYLGASNDKRSAHPFTGFDPNDDLPLAPASVDHRGLGQLLRVPNGAAAALQPVRIRPYPLFNVALNLVGGKNLAWQQRKAAAFIFSPEYCGFEYRVDEDNEQERKEVRQDGNVAVPRAAAFRSAYARTVDHAHDPSSLTVGLAVATSGAAASPNMGYHTSPTLAFLMTVFNVRLGWWLRNPRWAEVWSDQRYRLSLRELLSELLGLTTDDRSWVYLSDGGHFENLGIYELVRRRCRFIVASDAGQDGNVTFEDLGNAIEKCRSDFGVDIEIDLTNIRHSAARFSEWHCAIGSIRYDSQNPDEAQGTLLYIKSSLTGDESADVLRYASLHPAFPHESTSDQFFDESQFESYRALGYHIGCNVLSAAAERDEMSSKTVVELFTDLRQQWTLSAPAPPDAVRKYSKALADIWTTVRTTPELAFLDVQLFPEWVSFLTTGRAQDRAAAAAAPPPPEVNYWLPESSEERRAGFYVCSQMLQLMEDVYLEFSLDRHFDHIDNRGWMNLFQHWAWSGMLGATFAITGSTWDPRFQRFCKRRLSLSPGFTFVASKYEIELPLPAEWLAWAATEPARCEKEMADWQQFAGYNFWEATLIDKFLSASTLNKRLQIVPIRIVAESPRKSDGNPLEFNVGYLIGEWDKQHFKLHHMRVQNHLRKMGLARAALEMIALPAPRGWGMTLEVVMPDPRRAGGNVALDEALPSPAWAADVQRIVKSLPQPSRSQFVPWPE
jgi:hypothetical protein